MNTKIVNGKEAVARVVGIAEANSGILGASIATQVAHLKQTMDAIDNLGEQQIGGTNTFLVGVAERRAAAKELRTMLVDLAAMARALEGPAHPGLSALVQMGGHLSYQALRDRAAAAVTALTPIKAEFISRGFEPTFLEDLAAQAAKLQTATDKKYLGLNGQVQSTATLKYTMQAALKEMRGLVAAMKAILRKANPGIVDALKRAAHVRSRAKGTDATATLTPPPTSAPADIGTPTTPSISTTLAPVPSTPTVTPRAKWPQPARRTMRDHRGNELPPFP